MKDSFIYITAGEDGFKGELLDKLLEAGYYRMQHFMFTCNETIISENLLAIPVFWLRTVIKDCKPEGSARNILKKCSGFSVVLKPAYVNDEIETLYQAYKNHVAFKVADSAADYLHQQFVQLPFDSMMIKIYDGTKLIAAGYFDQGQNAIAGILNIYHPQYNMYSLGKFLILQKLEYALFKNMQYYYTGYISTESTRFDYKTFPDAKAVEVLLPMEKIWVPYKKLGKLFLADYYARLLASINISS